MHFEFLELQKLMLSAHRAIGRFQATRSWYVLGASTKKDSHLSAGHLLQWHAIRWAKEHGCSDYDFDGYREGINTGPPLFKRAFCQSVVHFSPAYRYPLKRRLYSILKVVTAAG